MSRRVQVGLAAALVVALVLSAWLTSGFGLWSGSGGSGSSNRPNIVLILTDDQRWDQLSDMPEVRTLLAGYGVTFTNAFVTTSSCCPSRTSILTGQYSHHTGVLDSSTAPPPGGALAFHDKSTLATWLHGAGYTTALMGKYLNGYAELPTGYVPPGWDEWDAVAQPHPEDKYYGYELNENGRIVKYGAKPSAYSTNVLAQKATSFIRGAHSPFFLYFAPVAPHSPATPAPGDAGRFANLPPYRPRSFAEANVSDKPWAPVAPAWTPKKTANVDLLREHVLESLLAVDRAVKAIYDAVAARGELANTSFIFTSDNGLLLGEHRLSGKIWPYEESIRVPLVIRTPGVGASRSDSHLVLNIDLASTVAQLASVKPGLPQDGRSLVPFLQGKNPPWRTAFVEEFLGSDPNLPPPFEALRTTRYLFVEYRNGWRELYDLKTDPYELRNLAVLSKERRVRAALARRLHTMYSQPAGSPPT